MGYCDIEFVRHQQPAPVQPVPRERRSAESRAGLTRDATTSLRPEFFAATQRLVASLKTDTVKQTAAIHKIIMAMQTDFLMVPLPIWNLE
jgi:hypothetical protein